jgi:hypothetical protein
MDSDSNEPVSGSGKSKLSLRRGNQNKTKNGVYSDEYRIRYCIIFIFNVYIQIQIRIQQKPVSGSISWHCIVHDGVRRLVDHHLGLRGKKEGQSREILGFGQKHLRHADRLDGKGPQII